MKILLIHNRYKQYGGEDATFEAEKTLLERHNNTVRTLIYENDGSDHFIDKLKLGLSLFYNFNSARALGKLIQDFVPDVIHLHNLFYKASPSIIIEAHKRGIPIIVTLQNYRLICAGALLMRDLKPCEVCVRKKFPIAGIRHGCHRGSSIQTANLTLVTGVHKVLSTWNTKVSKYIAVTEFAKSKYVNSSLRLRPDKVIVKPSSVEDVAPSAHSDRENTFLYVGRLSEEKGISTLIAAFAGLGQSLEIIGDGPLRNRVELAVSENENIVYSGYREKSFIVSKLKKCKALIVSSIWYECLPVTILEAFATGTPVIISDIGNLNEIVTHRYNGLHFKVNDPKDLARIVNEFCTNREAYLALYENARTTYELKYSPAINYENLMAIYSNVIEVKRVNG